MLNVQMLETIVDSDFNSGALEKIDGIFSNAGYSSFSIGVIQPIIEGVLDPITNFNSEYLDVYNTKQYYLNDPVLKQALCSNTPNTWLELKIRNKDSKIIQEIYSTSSDFGIDTGLFIPIYTKMGRALISLQYDGNSRELIRQMETSILGTMGLCQAILAKLVQQSPQSISARPKLTAKELECLKYLIDGFSNIEIARFMSVSINRIKELIASLSYKFNAYNRTEVAVFGFRNGYV